MTGGSSSSSSSSAATPTNGDNGIAGCGDGAAISAAEVREGGAQALGTSPDQVEVNLKCIDGTVTRLHVPKCIRGSGLKELIAERLSVPPERQRLIVRGRVIQEDDDVDQHITQNGQTIHFLQRPQQTLVSGDAQASAAGAQDVPEAPPGTPAASRAAPPAAAREPAVGAVDPSLQGALPAQAELSQLLTGMLGALSGATPGTVLTSTSLIQTPAPGGSNADAAAPAGRAVAPGVSAIPIPGLWRPPPPADIQAHRSWLFRDFVVLICLILCLALALPMLVWSVVQVESANVPSSSWPPWPIWALGFHCCGFLLGLPSLWFVGRPLRSLRMVVAQPAVHEQISRNAFSQSLASLLREPPQHLSYYRQGSLMSTTPVPAAPPMAAGVPASAAASAVQAHGAPPQATAEASIASQPAQPRQDYANRGALGPRVGGIPMWVPLGAASAGAGDEAISYGASEHHHDGDSYGSEGLMGDGLPWQDLQCLTQHLAPLLGRNPPECSMPPAYMPHGELHAFIGSLHAATSQLGVGFGDVQREIVEGFWPQEPLRQNLAITCDAAAQVFGSLAAALHTGGSSTYGLDEDPAYYEEAAVEPVPSPVAQADQPRQ